jgi:hypothetical protein
MDADDQVLPCFIIVCYIQIFNLFPKEYSKKLNKQSFRTAAGCWPGLGCCGWKGGGGWIYAASASRFSFDDCLHQGDGADDGLKPEKLARSATPA